jgi:hypothetical protein
MFSNNFTQIIINYNMPITSSAKKALKQSLKNNNTYQRPYGNYNNKNYWLKPEAKNTYKF